MHNGINLGVFELTWRGWTAFVALGIIWGLPYFFIKIAVQEVSPLPLAFSRVRLAARFCCPSPGGAARCALGQAQSGDLRLCIGGVCHSVLAHLFRRALDQFLGHRHPDRHGAAVHRADAALFRRPRSAGRPGASSVSRLGFIGVAALLGTGPISWPLGWAGVACMLLATLWYAIGPLDHPAASAGPRFHRPARRKLGGSKHHFVDSGGARIPGEPAVGGRPWRRSRFWASCAPRLQCC